MKSRTSVTRNGYLEVAKEILERRGYKTQIKKDLIHVYGGDPLTQGKINSIKSSLSSNRRDCYIVRSFEDIGLKLKVQEGELVVF